MPEQSEDQLSNIFVDLNLLSLKRQQFTDRRNVLAMLIQFKKNNGQNEQQYSKEREELQKIDEKLKELSEKKVELEQKQERLNGLPTVINTSSSGVVFVDRPPDFPAPQVILDVRQLPPQPSLTQCPFCQQFITTDVSTQVGSVAYLMCFISIIFGCVAGCCLIPFCVDSLKDVIHKCPKCRSHITTCKRF